MKSAEAIDFLGPPIPLWREGARSGQEATIKYLYLKDGVFIFCSEFRIFVIRICFKLRISDFDVITSLINKPSEIGGINRWIVFSAGFSRQAKFISETMWAQFVIGSN
jgi:hypothetical protein